MPSFTAAAARARLLGDQAVRPVAERRAALAILSRRLDAAGRNALMQGLVPRVRAEPRFGPVVGRLVGMTLRP